MKDPPYRSFFRMNRAAKDLLARLEWVQEPDVFAGRFRIEREAGIGGTSTVYRALDQDTGAIVALKVLQRTDKSALRRFDAEAQALETLRHHAIVRYIAHGIEDDQPYLAMEWIEGETLGLCLERGAFSVRDVLVLGRRIADALVSAHALGILHRDIKPSNVLLPGGTIEEAKIADFGLARFMEANEGDEAHEAEKGNRSRVTRTGIIVGTPGYMSPEQAHGERYLDGRADLFSLGCLLFRCLTEIEAFEGSRALTALAKLVLFDAPRVAELRPGIPAALDQMVTSLLAKEREQRPASATEVRDAFDRMLENAPSAMLSVACKEDESIPWTPGTAFGRFVLEGRLGAGGMGEVFRAHDTVLERPVALKILRGSPDRETRARLLREARVAAALSHPNIVTIYDVGELEGIPFLTMERVRGSDLRAYVGEATVSLDQRIHWMIETARGLAAAHQAGVVHGDVKPANVMIGQDGAVKILDFGLAAAVPGCVGTPAYMPPEQIRGESLDGRADQFSWAVTAYELFTGHLPWPGNDPVATLGAVLWSEPTTLTGGGSMAEIVPEVADVIRRALRKERDERFPTMEAVLEALEAAVQSAADRARASSAPQALEPRVVRRTMGVGVSIFAALVACVVFAAFRAQSAWLAPKAPSSQVPVPAIPRPSATLITALPASPTCAPVAAAFYQQGLVQLRSADWGRARILFEKASDVDPSCPEVQLRLTMLINGPFPAAQQRDQLRRTFLFRDALSERDRILLDAWASTIAADAPEQDDSIRILEDGIHRFPEDAELPHLLVSRSSYLALKPARIEKLLEYERRATELDPGYADAWQGQAVLLSRLDRDEEERAALNRCLEVAPGATDCMEQRIALLRRQGRCAEASSDAQHLVEWQPGQSTVAYAQLAGALASQQGASRDAVQEALVLRWEQAPEATRELRRLCDSAELSVWAGDFEGALRIARQLEQRAVGAATASFHVCAAVASINALVETGQGVQAAELSARFRRRNEAWASGDPAVGRATKVEEEKPFLLAAELEYGSLPPARWRETADAWERANAWRTSPRESWAYRWGPAIGSRIDAHEALLRDPSAEAGGVGDAFTHQPDNGPFRGYNVRMRDAYEGRIRLLGGDASRAIPLLEAAAHSCQGIEQASLHVRAHLWLGTAKEKVGDIPAACDAYGFIRSRWGASKPRSVTAHEAERRMVALGCPR